MMKSSNNKRSGGQAVFLREKQVRQKQGKENDPPPLAEALENFRAAVSAAVREDYTLSESSVQKFRNALAGSYAEESLFNNELFEALRACVDPFVINKGETNAESCIVIDAVVNANKGVRPLEYAVGFARNASAGEALIPDSIRNEKYASTTTGMRASAIPDHAVCLFRRNFLTCCWEPMDFFAVVELKLSDTTCTTFDTDPNNFRVPEKNVDLEGTHDALCQVIIFNLEYVLLYLARRGKLGEHLPLAVVAAKRSDKTTQPDSLQWVWGQLHIPEACGDTIYYSVNNFGRFDETASVGRALALYLHTMTFGLNAATQVRNELDTSALSNPCPASGRFLQLGGHTLGPTFCASPIHGANPFPGDSKWIISQGDLFKGRLDVGETVKLAKEKVVFASSAVIGQGEVDVLVKVSSITVHSPLVDPALAFAALERIKNLGVAADEIGSVLYAVIRIPAGLMTIMADLSEVGYRDLRPTAAQDKIEHLWEGFRRMVEKVLLPLAEIANVIHPDIRPGYDFTANILSNFDDTTSTATMKLIDYESLVALSNWRAPKRSFGKYLSNDDMPDAVTFVWWLCARVAFAWMERLKVDALYNGKTGSELDRFRTSLLENGFVPSWLHAVRGDAEGEISSLKVHELLKHVSKVFKQSQQKDAE